jgi:hypothetical protein
MDLARVAAVLKCDAASVTRLALCFRPRPEPAAFRSDVACLATSTGVDEARLTSFLREAQSLAAFRKPAAEGRMLAAARDQMPRDEDEE